MFRASGIMQYLTEIGPHMASESQLMRFHTEEYVARVKALSDAYGGEVGDFTALCAGGYDFARLAVGGCIAAFDAVLEEQGQETRSRWFAPADTMPKRTAAAASRSSLTWPLPFLTQKRSTA